MSKLSDYNYKQIGQKQSKRFVETEYDFKKKSGKFDIGNKDIEHILEGIEEEAEKNNERVKIMIRGLNIDKWFTLKTFSQDINLLDDDDYYNGKVKESSKFEKFGDLRITVMRSKNATIKN